MSATPARPTFAGTYTALVTPMQADGAVDWPALDALVDAQLPGGVDGVVVCGSTGEAATLAPEERLEALRRVVTRVAGRCRVIFGSGAQGTHETVQAQRAAEAAGCDATLVVTPFYNRPSPEGLLRHFRSVAEAAQKPIILYNVPTRTGCDLRPELVAQLAQLPQVVGLKDATGELERFGVLREATPSTFALLSGDDPSAAAACLLGADGLVSVASNLVPAEVVELVRAAREGHAEQARGLQRRLRPLFLALGLETNPVPVKTALALRGEVQEAFRLPLCEMQPRARQRLLEVLQAGGWARPG